MTYDPASGEITTGSGVYPQAPLNVMVKAAYSF